MMMCGCVCVREKSERETLNEARWGEQERVTETRERCILKNPFERLHTLLGGNIHSLSFIFQCALESVALKTSPFGDSTEWSHNLTSN